MSAMLTRFLCLLLFVLLAGCSRTDMLYGNADWLLKRWAVDLLDPDSAQADAWQAVMHGAMQTHQRELLPDVVVLLKSAEVSVADGLERAELLCWSGALEQVYRAHAEWAVVPASEVLSGVSAAQIAHLAAELRERNQAYRDDYLDDDPQKRRQQRLQRYIERIQRWTGDLSAAQRHMLEQSVAEMPDLAGSWLSYREQRQRGLLALLRTQPDRAALQDYLAGWWVHLADRPPTLVQNARILRLASLDMVLRLDAMLTLRQRANFVEKVADLREELADLVADDERLRLARVAQLPCMTGLSTRPAQPG